MTWRHYCSRDMRVKMKHSPVLGFAVCATVLAGASAGQTLGPRAPTFQGATVTSSAVIEDIAEILQSRFGDTVTYEDPVWQWPGDWQNRPGQPYGSFPIQRTVNIPAELTPDQMARLSATAFERVLDEYNKSYDAPRYRVTQSKLGLHVIPKTLRDAAGNIIAARNPLDAVVSVPTATRAAPGHLLALCAAISRVAELQLQCGSFYQARQPSWGTEAFAAPGGAFEWGVGLTSARDALVDLLSKLTTTFSWRLRCASPLSGDHVCVLDVSRVQIAKPDGKGGLTARPLLYDRCPTCTPPAGPARPGLLPGPPPPVR
jgi:hypothetical protein